MIPQVSTNTPHQQLCAVSLLGNLVAKPDIRYRANPVCAITEITIATNSKWLDKSTNTYKEWTSYHHIIVEGELVEQTLLTAEKGDVLLLQGYLTQTKSTNKDFIHATFLQKFAKGYTPSINQIHCSGTVFTPVKLMTTPQNKSIAEFTLAISSKVYSDVKKEWININFFRPVHIWGKQALYINQHLSENDPVVIEGKLSYASDAKKAQYIEAKNIHLFKG